MEANLIRNLLIKMAGELSQEIGALYEDYGVPPEEFVDYSCSCYAAKYAAQLERLMKAQAEA